MPHRIYDPPLLFFQNSQQLLLQYVSTMAHGFFGIHDVQCIRAEGLDIIGADVEAILSQAKLQADTLL